MKEKKAIVRNWVEHLSGGKFPLYEESLIFSPLVFNFYSFYVDGCGSTNAITTSVAKTIPMVPTKPTTTQFKTCHPSRSDPPASNMKDADTSHIPDKKNMKQSLAARS